MFRKRINRESLLSEERRFWDHESQISQDGSFETLTDLSYKKIISYFQIPPHSRGLEYACGSGAFSSFITARMIVGLDLSLNLLKNAKSIIPVQGNGETLPFRDESFDFVLCAAALHHIPRVRVALEEIARVLKRGGFLYIFELNTNHPQRRIVARRKSLMRSTFKGTHFSPTEALIPEKTLLSELSRAACIIKGRDYISPAYRNPTSMGKLQIMVSRFLAKGFLTKYLESYILIRAQKALLEER